MPDHDLNPRQKLVCKLCDQAIKAPSVPFSTQRGEERRVLSMVERSDRLSAQTAALFDKAPFVVGKWQHQVIPTEGIRQQMFASAQRHTQPTGAWLSEQSMKHFYSRQVRFHLARAQSCRVDRVRGRSLCSSIVHSSPACGSTNS